MMKRENIFFFFDGYCSTVQGLLDWFEVDLGFTKLSFIQILGKRENEETRKHPREREGRRERERAEI